MTTDADVTIEITAPAEETATADPLLPDAEGFVAADYVRTVHFIDRYWRGEGHDDTSWPIHVIGTHGGRELEVELDGNLLPGVKDAAVKFGIDQSTIVTLWVDPALCGVAAPARYSDGSYGHAAIDGHLVLAPEKPAWWWDGARELIACNLFAARVVFE